MSQKAVPYQVVEFPPARRDAIFLLDMYFWWIHCIYGFCEADVTLPRRFIETYAARSGEKLSFTAYLIYCLARAVSEDKSVQAYRKGRKQLAIFDDVDVGVPVERQVSGQDGGSLSPVGQVIRRAERKSYLEIHREIRALQTQPVPPGKGEPPWLRMMLSLPPPLPRLLGLMLRAAMRRNPGMLVSQAGTVGVTSVGMFSHGNFWGLTPPMHSLFLIVGGMARKPGVVAERVEPRQILNLTIGFDHDVIDGAPAARFTRRLLELIESGCGLEELDPAIYAAAREETR